MQGKSLKYFSRSFRDVITEPMRDTLDRTILTVIRDGGGWAVEFQGAFFGHDSEKEVAKAFALKRAREVIESGGAAQVRMHGEGGYS